MHFLLMQLVFRSASYGLIFRISIILDRWIIFLVILLIVSLDVFLCKAMYSFFPA